MNRLWTGLYLVLSFDSIVELVLARAQRDDPSDLGLIVYKRRTSPEGPAGDAYRRRSDAYDVLIETLRLLHAIAISKNKGVFISFYSPLSYNLPFSLKFSGGTLPVLTSASIFASAPVALNGLSPTNAALERDTMIQRVIQSEDELANISLFRWMMTNGLSNQLLKVLDTCW